LSKETSPPPAPSPEGEGEEERGGGCSRKFYAAETLSFRRGWPAGRVRSKRFMKILIIKDKTDG